MPYGRVLGRQFLFPMPASHEGTRKAALAAMCVDESPVKKSLGSRRKSNSVCAVGIIFRFAGLDSSG